MTPDTTKRARSRRPGLDVIRGAAITFVLVGHSGFGEAGIGVTLFFVLSGFLITTLLVEERATDGRIDIRAFYQRRIARLLPALLVLVAVIGLAATLGGDRQTVMYGLLALGYFTNILTSIGVHMGVFRHTWSLSVEEQFYLVWPLVFIVARRARYVVIAAVLMLLWGAIAFDPPIEYRTDIRGGAIAAGCALALVDWRPGPRLTLAAGLGLLALFTQAESGALYLLVAIASTILVGWGANAPTNVPVLPYLGRISYSLYLWHVPMVVTFGPLIGVPLAIGVAAISTRWFEEPLRARLQAGRLLSRRGASDSNREPPIAQSFSVVENPATRAS